MGLKVSQDRRLLEQDGKPFFWLGDTAWEIFHRLNREEVIEYLDKRQQQQFNVIQAMGLAEFDGLRVPNAYGRRPLLQDEQGNFDPTRPDLGGEYSYWDHVDFVLKSAGERGINVALLPIWGDKFYLDAWGIGPVIFNPENARIYGRWIAERYKDRDNLLWVMGGDRVLLTRQHHGVIHQMALGIREVVGQNQLITFHPTGASSSSRHLHAEDWLDFNMIQSGHRVAQTHNDLFVEQDYTLLPTKPTLEAEPRYEDHPKDFDGQNGYFDAADVRLAAYRAVLAGSLGVTYGHHSVWSYWRDEYEWPGKQAYVIMNWRKAIERPGANQMRHLRHLMESRPMSGRVPDQSLLVEDYPGANHMRAIRGQGHVFVYSPCGIPFSLRLGVLPGANVMASWFDPRSGESHSMGTITNSGERRFMPPSSGRGDDWVLILDQVQE